MTITIPTTTCFASILLSRHRFGHNFASLTLFTVSRPKNNKFDRRPWPSHRTHTITEDPRRTPHAMSFHRGGGPRKPGNPAGGGSSNSSQRTGSGFSMNAVPPPSSLLNRPTPFQRGHNALAGASKNTAAAAAASGLSKHGYSTLESISQFANSSQYAIGKRKSKTEDE